MIVSEPESFTFRGEGVALTCSWRRWEIKLLSGFTKKLLNYISCTNVFFTYRRLILWQLELYELLNIKNGLCHMFTKAWRLKELNWTDITYIEVSECCSWSHVICGHQIFLNQPFSRYSIAGTFPQHQFCILLNHKYNKPLLWHEEEVSCSISFDLSPIKARQSQCHHQSKSEKRDIQLQFNLILHNKCHTMSIKTEKCSYKKHVLYCMRWHIKWHQKHGNASIINMVMQKLKLLSQF